nr:RNA-directed DNA polymerase, eukaryota, reverse transcriptase zinc-binding domain protein [Tanacetum cinerariifolium]
MLDKEDGGLGISSLKGKNLGLLAKWKWRFFNDSDALWCKVILEIHGSKGGFDVSDISSANSGVWVSLVKCCSNLNRFGIDLNEIMRQPTRRSLGDISSILNLINSLVFDTSKEDEWIWNIETSGNFSVSSLCSLIQKKMLVSYVDSPKFVWNSWVPRKVNVSAWRVALDRLPTRENLSHRGLLNLDSSSSLFFR